MLARKDLFLENLRPPSLVDACDLEYLCRVHVGVCAAAHHGDAAHHALVHLTRSERVNDVTRPCRGGGRLTWTDEYTALYIFTDACWPGGRGAACMGRVVEGVARMGTAMRQEGRERVWLNSRKQQIIAAFRLRTAQLAPQVKFIDNQGSTTRARQPNASIWTRSITYQDYREKKAKMLSSFNRSSSGAHVAESGYDSGNLASSISHSDQYCRATAFPRHLDGTAGNGFASLSCRYFQQKHLHGEQCRGQSVVML